MRRNSLAFRLFVSAAAWSLLVLPITAIILISVYRSAVEQNFDSRLNVHLTSLVASAAAAPDLASSPPSLPDPNFKLPFSGWYWQITSADPDPSKIITSESLLDQRLSFPSQADRSKSGEIRSAYADGPANQELRVLWRDITIKRAGSPDTPILVLVAGNASEIAETVSDFRTLLIIALTVLGVGLLIATFFQVKYGLLPLQAIGRDLSAIRSGEAELLQSELPSEILPLQNDLNALIESNRGIVERARTHVGNLAHALKTPLSVITNEADAGRSALATTVKQQAAIMREQIDHHLNRASIAARSGVVSGSTRVQPVLEGLVRTLEKIYVERGVVIGMSCKEDVIFQGEKHDLEEMVGNLLDNACKWADSQITMSVAPHEHDLEIVIEDDGPGLSKNDIGGVMKRGRRLDESKPGSGLGLSIVAELADLYNGSFALKTAKIGGLRAVLRLPRA